MMTICRKIERVAEREALFRLRYAVYVEEMGRPQRHADHGRHRLAEPLDRGAIQLGAFDDETGRLIGGLRILFSDQSGLEGLDSLYGLRTGFDAERVAIVTRLVTEAGARGGESSAGVALACGAHRIALAEGASAAMIDCSTQRVPFFEWLGFDLRRSFEHPEYGPIAIMHIDLDDRDRLVKTGSPLLAALDEYRGTGGASGGPHG